MKKKLLIASIIGVMTLSGCAWNTPYENNPSNPVKTGKPSETIPYNDINFLDGIYGVYGNYNESEVEVLPGKDDAHIDLMIYEYRAFWNDIKDIEIKKDIHGVISGVKTFSDEDSIGENILNLTIRNDDIKLVFDKEIQQIRTNVIEKQKDKIRCITKQEKQRAIDMVLQSNCKNIAPEVFETVRDTQNYLVLRVKNYVYQEEDRDNYQDKRYIQEGYESVNMRKYYNFDKRKNKLLELADLYQKNDKVLKQLNSFIEDKIADEKLFLVGYTEWPYKEFEGIGKPDYFENYFMIDEVSKVVKIRCVDYSIEAYRGAGDVCIDVPFSIFPNM